VSKRPITASNEAYYSVKRGLLRAFQKTEQAAALGQALSDSEPGSAQVETQLHKNNLTCAMRSVVAPRTEGTLTGAKATASPADIQGDYAHAHTRTHAHTHKRTRARMHGANACIICAELFVKQGNVRATRIP